MFCLSWYSGTRWAPVYNLLRFASSVLLSEGTGLVNFRFWLVGVGFGFIASVLVSLVGACSGSCCVGVAGICTLCSVTSSWCLICSGRAVGFWIPGICWCCFLCSSFCVAGVLSRYGLEVFLLFDKQCVLSSFYCVTYLRLYKVKNAGPMLLALAKPGVIICVNFSSAAVDGFGCLALRQLHDPLMRMVRQSVFVQIFSLVRSSGVRPAALNTATVVILPPVAFSAASSAFLISCG